MTPPPRVGPGPYAFHPHPLTWVCLLGGASVVVFAHRHLRARQPETGTWSTREQRRFWGAWLVAALLLTWPIADVAAHWSLTVLVLQRVGLELAVAPLLLLGLPYNVLERATRPRLVDVTLDRCRHPAVAVAVVTVLSVGSMTTPLVAAQASSVVARGVLDVVVVASGAILWIPIIGRVPGMRRVRAVGRFAYLVVQAILPAFLSFIYIFSRHPLYPQFSGSRRAIGLRPLADQEIAGFASKLSMLFVLIGVGAVVLNRAQRAAEVESDAELDAEADPAGSGAALGGDPLLWVDVERVFTRIDRLEGRRGRGPGEAGPGAGGGERDAGSPSDEGSS